MNINKETIIVYALLVVGFFYYITTAHQEEIAKHKEMLQKQDETIQLQTQAIQMQQRQNQYLLQYYYSTQNLSPLNKPDIVH